MIYFVVCLPLKIGFGASVYASVTNVHLGAWWAGAVCVISAIVCVAATNKGVLTAGCVFAVINGSHLNFIIMLHSNNV